MPKQKNIVPENIATRILFIRNQKVIIDSDLANLYRVPTKRLNEQVKRNSTRFPADFMFQLTPIEKNELVANCDQLNKLKHAKTMPFAFTEHGIIMAASVLNSDKAIEVSVLIVRTFIKLRQLLSTNFKLKQKLFELESRLTSHDETIQQLIDALHELMEKPESADRPLIGFAPW